MSALVSRTYGRFTMSEHLSALDATFLELEEGDETAHMHIGALVVFEAPPSGPPPTLDGLIDSLGERLVAVPRYTQRLSERHTGGLRWPSWEDDPRFDLRNHVTRAALPAPGGDTELLEWVSDYWSIRLDRARPLWEIVLLEGLAGGRWALATKTHHCMLDGAGSVDVGYVLLDGERNPPPARWRPPAATAGEHDGGLRATVGRAAHALDPRHVPDILQRSRAAAAMLWHDEVMPAPHSSLNRPIGTRRRIAAVTIGLDELKEIKRSVGGTVNDVALAAVAGGLRTLLLERGEEPPAGGLRAMVPVNIRQASEKLALGNRVTTLFAHLRVDKEDPIERYLATLSETEALKGGDEALGSHTVIGLTALAPPVLHATLARGLFASRLFNVTVTNVPGPPRPIYGFGCEVDQIFGLVPLAAEHAVGVCIVSYAGEVTFTIAGDHDSLADIDVLADGIRESLGELRKVLAHA